MYAVTVTMAGRWYKPRQPDNLNMCFAFENHTMLLVGVSIYDANYDAAPRNCSKFQGGPWARVAWIDKMRKLLNVPQDPGRFLGVCLHDIRRRRTIAVDRVLDARARLPRPRRTFT
ncbi:hypothetical protein MTO96_002306 [Rhipicephalus appendiculatus]